MTPGGAAVPAALYLGCYFVIAVPSGAASADLVLTDAGRKQTLSLLTGKPSAGNLAVLARAHRVSSSRKSFSVPITFSTTVVFGDGTQGTAVTYAATLDGARLDWTPPAAGWVTPARPGDALLTVELSYTDPHHPGGGPYMFHPEWLTFTPDGGAPIAARNVSRDPDRWDNVIDVFEVPASLTTGVLTISGAAKSPVNSNGWSFTATVATPVKARITFQAG